MKTISETEYNEAIDCLNRANTALKSLISEASLKDKRIEELEKQLELLASQSEIKETEVTVKYEGCYCAAPKILKSDNNEYFCQECQKECLVVEGTCPFPSSPVVKQEENTISDEEIKQKADKTYKHYSRQKVYFEEGAKWMRSLFSTGAKQEITEDKEAKAWVDYRDAIHSAQKFEQCKCGKGAKPVSDHDTSFCGKCGNQYHKPLTGSDKQEKGGGNE